MTNEEFNALKAKIVIKPCTIIMEFGNQKKFKFEIQKQTQATLVADMMLDRILSEVKEETKDNKVQTALLALIVSVQIVDIIIKTIKEQELLS